MGTRPNSWKIKNKTNSPTNPYKSKHGELELVMKKSKLMTEGK